MMFFQAECAEKGEDWEKRRGKVEQKLYNIVFFFVACFAISGQVEPMFNLADCFFAEKS